MVKLKMVTVLCSRQTDDFKIMLTYKTNILIGNFIVVLKCCLNVSVKFVSSQGLKQSYQEKQFDKLYSSQLIFRYTYRTRGTFDSRYDVAFPSRLHQWPPTRVDSFHTAAGGASTSNTTGGGEGGGVGGGYSPSMSEIKKEVQLMINSACDKVDTMVYDCK